LAVVAGMKKPNDHAKPTKSRTLKKQNKKTLLFNDLTDLTYT